MECDLSVITESCLAGCFSGRHWCSSGIKTCYLLYFLVGLTLWIHFIYFKALFLFYIVWLCCLHVCMCLVLRKARRKSQIPWNLYLEFQVDVCHHEIAGTEPGLSARAVTCSTAPKVAPTAPLLTSWQQHAVISRFCHCSSVTWYNTWPDRTGPPVPESKPGLQDLLHQCMK